MTACPDIRLRIALYLDGELTGAEALAFEAHLTECEDCRREYESQRGTVDTIRGTTPIYEVPQESYTAVRGMVADWERRQKVYRWAPAIAAALLLAVTGLWVAGRPSGYEQFAVQTHRGYTRGTFPLDISSREPQVVSGWLASRVPFHLQLPNYPDGRPKPYRLAGARLMQYRGEDVAYLAYEMDQKPISLLISSSSRIMPSYGETYQSGGLTFHFSAEQGLRIITWTDKGLTYAQVSDLDVKGAESCAICHGAEEDRSKFERLGRRLHTQ